MIYITLNPTNFQIDSIWEDNGETYISVEVAPNLYVDVKYPNYMPEQVITMIQADDSPYSYLMNNTDGGYVYDMNSHGDSVAEISEDDAWRVVQFVDDELYTQGEDYL